MRNNIYSLLMVGVLFLSFSDFCYGQTDKDLKPDTISKNELNFGLSAGLGMSYFYLKAYENYPGSIHIMNMNYAMFKPFLSYNAFAYFSFINKKSGFGFDMGVGYSNLSYKSPGHTFYTPSGKKFWGITYQDFHYLTYRFDAIFQRPIQRTDNKLMLGMGLGAAYSFLIDCRMNARSINSDDPALNGSSQSSEMVNLRRHGVWARVKGVVRYQFHPKWSLSINPTFTMHLYDHYKPNNSIPNSETLYSIGADFAILYKLK